MEMVRGTSMEISPRGPWWTRPGYIKEATMDIFPCYDCHVSTGRATAEQAPKGQFISLN
jgi:hypothetical protein